MANPLYLYTLLPHEIVNRYGISPSEYTRQVNQRINETDIAANNHTTHVSLYLLPF